MPDVVDRVDVTVYRDPAAYTSHPCVTRLANGDLLVAFNESLPRRPWLHPPTDPRYVNLVARSRDGGQTWLAPRVAPSYEVTGVECPSITQLSSGAVVLVQWQFRWYPLETARKLARSDDSPDILLPLSRDSRGKRPTTDADWGNSAFPWARADRGLLISISTDDGATWDQTVVASTAPFRRGYSPRPPCELPDGSVLLALGSHDEQGAIYVLRSADGGRSWDPPVVVSDGPPMGEPTIAALPSGKLIVLSRERSGFLHQNDSYDGGRTWTPTRRTPIWGFPPHLLRLSDGRLLVVYGIRRPPFGVRACLSADDGETWDYDHELVIRDDMLNENLGYPTAVELPDGQIFAAYYGEDAAGVTHIVGSTFRLP